MPSDHGSIGFRPATADDYPLLETWLAQPHMRQWWGDRDEELGFIRDMVEGRDSTRPFLITLEGRPVGYIQYWFIGDHQNAKWVKDNPWLMELPEAAVGVDLSIGEPDLLSAGIGSAALRGFVAMLRHDGHQTIVIDPDPQNLRAVRAYKKAGFSPIPHLEGRTPGVLLMQHDPNVTETTP
jgi:RimJ/RimL family protein N-acetyltransferase